jgi:hypothetical protein
VCLHVLQIKALSDFLLFIEFIIALLMPLLINVQLFANGLHYVFMIATLLSHVVTVVISNML